MFKQLLDSVGNGNTRKILVGKRPVTLTEAVHLARLTEMATSVARGNKTGKPIAAVAARKLHKPVQQFQQSDHSQGQRLTLNSVQGDKSFFKVCPEPKPAFRAAE